MRAIDLYSGVGGWSLGLKMAGIDVVQSYERWPAANETNRRNNRHLTNNVNLRTFDFGLLSETINFVVGSPPCTQFSLSNRGGCGNFSDGLIDIVKFFEAVDKLKPRFWAMENVPRVAQVIAAELRKGGRLQKFKHLGIRVETLNFENFGLPQRRRRCIVGNLDFDLLKSYSIDIPKRTLGDVVRAFAAPSPVDPIYGFAVDKEKLFDHVLEECLSAEEERINRTSKMAHPVYNGMQFPDPLDRSVRTITATSTRVSRESIIIEDMVASGRYRRLTIRESASAQGFPATFQFYARGYSQKMRMVGNAVPPVFSFYVGQAMLGTPRSELKPLFLGIEKFKAPTKRPPVGIIECAGSAFPIRRRFRFAIPNLQLKSGVRFELSNSIEKTELHWLVSLYFGTPKSIMRLSLNEKVRKKIESKFPSSLAVSVRDELASLREASSHFDSHKLQRAWRHEEGYERLHPFVFLDRMGECGAALSRLFESHNSEAQAAIELALATQFRRVKGETRVVGSDKLFRHAPLVISGLLIGCTANLILNREGKMTFRGSVAAQESVSPLGA